MPRGEAGVCHASLLAQRAPIAISALKPVLVAQHVTRPEAETHEIDLHLILIRRELRERDLLLSERRNGLRHAVDPHSTDQDGRRRSRSVRGRRQAGKAGGGAEPQDAGGIAER